MDTSLAAFQPPHDEYNEHNVEDADAVVIGAGPAGAAAALHLARHGLRVVIIERRRFGDPTNDTLRSGEGLIPATRRALANLGLALRDAPWALDQINRVRMVWPHGATTTSDISARGGLVMVDREQLDYALFNAAVQAGASGREGCRARSLYRVDGGRVAGVWVLTSDEQPLLLRAPLVIDAGGRNALSLRELPIRAYPEDGDFFAICHYFDDMAELERGVWEMHLIQQQQLCVLQICRLRDGLVRCGLGAPSSALVGSTPHPQDVFDACLERAPQLARRLAQATTVAKPFIRGKLGYRVREATFDGLMLVGDATGYINPLFGDGVLRALNTAQQAATTAIAALAAGDTSRAGLESYARYHAATARTSRVLRWGLLGAYRAPPMLRAIGAIGPVQRAAFGALMR